MAAINFPSSPQVNDTVVADEVTYIWDGEKWKANTYVPESVTEVLDTKQNTLVSGTNIKTVNSTSLLGSGDVAVQPTLVSGTSIKTVNSTSLLGSGDVAVQPTLVSGTNIKTVNGTSILGSGNLTVSVTAPTASTTSRGVVYGFSQDSTNTGSAAYDNTGIGFGQTWNTISGGTYSNVAIGNNTSISGFSHNNVAIGKNASISVDADNSVTIGASTTTGTNGVVIGGSAMADSVRSVVIGQSARAQNSNAVVIGMSGYSYGSHSTLIGYGSKDGGNSAIIINGNNNGSDFTAPSSGFFVTGVTNETGNNVLYYNTTTKKITYGAPAGGDLALEDLTNVSISNPTSGQVLKYNGTNWVNAADETGGGGEEEPTTVITTTLLAPTQFGTYGSQDCYLAFNSTADRDYFVHVFNFLKASASYYNDSGIFQILATVNSTVYQINVWSYSSSYTYGSNFDLYSVSYTNLGGGPSGNSVAFSATVQAASLVDPTNLGITLANDSVINGAFSQLFVDSNLPYGTLAYPGNFAPSQIQAPSTSAPYGPPRTGTDLAATDSTIGPSGSYVLNNTNGFLILPAFNQTSYAYIRFFLGKTTVTQSGGGGSTPAYTPSWFKLSADSPSNAVTPGPFTSPNLVPYESGQVPVPTDFVPASVPPNYSLRGVLASLAPWGSNYASWNTFSMDMATSTTGNFAIFRYSFNPYNVPANIGFYSYDSNQGAFALTFFVKGSSIAFGMGAQDNSWAGFNMSQSQSPYSLPSSNAPSPGGPFQAFKMVFVADYVAPNTTVSSFTAAGQPFTPAHIDQVIVYDQNSNTYYFVGLMTVTDPAVVSTINSSGFSMTPNNPMFIRAFGWFEV